MQIFLYIQVFCLESSIFWATLKLEWPKMPFLNPSTYNFLSSGQEYETQGAVYHFFSLYIADTSKQG